ncbi:MAG: 50S ribosomal protein L25 [Proteobacteria bacterium]|nr:50S ribosomal protein L25 [Pseudomonadota bacterium]
MEPLILRVAPRQGRGKGVCRQLRQKGRLPGVFYGSGVAAQALELSPKDLMEALSGEHRQNTLLRLDIGGRFELAMVKELQLHPVDRRPLHVDFYRVDTQSSVRARVPFRTTGRAKGVVRGGALTVVYRDLPIQAPPHKIPAHITFDVTNLDLNGIVQVKDLELAKDVEVLLPGERNLVTIGGERASGDEEEAEASSSESSETSASATKAKR